MSLINENDFYPTPTKDYLFIYYLFLKPKGNILGLSVINLRVILPYH